MQSTPLEQQIAAIIAPSIEHMGFRLVRVQLQDGKRQTLQIMAERLDGKPMQVDHCAEISDMISMLLDVEDPIKSAYQLEVASPGLDRPLMNAADFRTWAGFEAKIETMLAVGGRKRFRGLLKSATDAEVTIEVDKEDYTLALANIRKAKLVINDALLKAHTQSATETV